MNQTRKIIGLMALLLVLLSTTGCAMDQMAFQPLDVKLERVNSDTAVITSIYLQKRKEGMVLNGELDRRSPTLGFIPGDLYVELISPDGKVVKEAEIDYQHKGGKSRGARFSLVIPEPLDKGSTIRVTHHDKKFHTPDSSASPWRDVSPVDQN